MPRERNEPWTVPALKEYVDQRFAASEVAVTTALFAAEKAVTAALVAAEKAVTKAELSQEKVNATQNEFRGTLRDQAAELMPRAETELIYKELRGAIEDLQRSRDFQGGGTSVATWFITTGLVIAGLFATIVSVYLARH
jgi:hypothetical protein